MTHLERQVRNAQHRLWMNRWLVGLSWFLTGGVALVALFILVQRLFEISIAVSPVAIAILALSTMGSLIWTMAKREQPSTAAAMLDHAAGLRERLSTAHFCMASDSSGSVGSESSSDGTSPDKKTDPFAMAVVSDAETISGSLSAREHIRLRCPASFGWTTVTLAIMAAMFLVPVGLLTSSEAAEQRDDAVELRQTQVAVKRQMDHVKKLVQDIPVLSELDDKLDGTEEKAGGKLHRPGDIRHEAIKRIDKLADAVKQKRAGGKYESVREVRKMLRGLKTPKSKDAPTRKLTKALAKGDFKTAQEELKELKEQLATLKSEQDKEMVAKMSKQLDELAKQLEKLAKNEQLVKKLVQAGLKKEDVKRMLENLKKEDLEQMKKTLEKKGLSQEQINKLAKQLKKGQQAGGAAKKLAAGMKKASQGANTGQMGESMAGLTMAGEQLSELEQLEQEMNQLDAAMADLQASANQISNPCPQCKGGG